MSALSDLAGFVAAHLPLVEGRVYPVVARQAEPRPCVTYTQDTEDAQHFLDQEAGYVELTATYTAWSPDYAECETLVEQLRLSLGGLRDATIGDTLIDCVLVEDGGSDSFEVLEGTDTGVYSKTLSFFIRYERLAATVPGY